MSVENSMENDGVRLHKKVRQRFIFPFVRAETCCLIREKEADVRNSRIFTRMQTHTLTRIHPGTHSHNLLKIHILFVFPFFLDNPSIFGLNI